MTDMLRHTAAVSRVCTRALVVADMPFGSYQASSDDGVANAVRLIAEGGAAAVKLEGGAPVAPLVERLVSAGIPVMGHLGLTPQSVNAFGGYKVQVATPRLRSGSCTTRSRLKRRGLSRSSWNSCRPSLQR